MMQQVLKKIYNSSGQSLVELLVVIGLLAVLLPAILTAFVTSREGKAQEYQRLKANAILNESVEALRSVRESGWSAVSANGTFHPQVDGPVWTLSAGVETVDEFTRSIVISDVERDSSGNIVTSGGIVDPSTRKAQIVVGWNSPYASSLERTYLLTRYLQNVSLMQTSQAEFSAGTLNDTETVNTNGGAVRLRRLGQNYRPSGTFESSSFDGLSGVGFNNLSWTATVPEGTSLQFQIAVNSDNTTWNFVGPDNSASTYFATSSASIPLHQLSGRYLKYKAFFNSNGSATPVLEDVSVNFSP